MLRQSEADLRGTIRQELTRLSEGITGRQLTDDVPLFDLLGDDSEGLGLDSLDALELAMTIEEKCGVRVSVDVDFKELATINDIVAYVTRLAEQQGPDGAE